MSFEWRSADGDPRQLAKDLRASAPADDAGIAAKVAETIASVRSGGDEALIELGRRYDGVVAKSIWVPAEERRRALEELSPSLREALEVAIANVLSVADAQVRGFEPVDEELAEGQKVVVDEVPVRSAAIYVPGGRAPYPSSVVMGVIPARVAGVDEVVVASPPDEHGLPAAPVLAAAELCGADAVLAAGGAQAIAALAYGTESVASVDVIAGPGSPWVQEAKLQCSRRVGIDGYAGPSELVVIADDSAHAEWLALDLLAQAEHGADGLLVAVSTSERVLDAIAAAIRSRAGGEPDATVTLALVADLEEGMELADALAPEHLQIDCADGGPLAARVRTAGCVFVGAASATAFGDYAAGSNHVLPTGGAGRYQGPLGPGTFRRRISRVEVSPYAAAELAPTVDAIARAEGFDLHADSVLARSEGRIADAERE